MKTVNLYFDLEGTIISNAPAARPGVGGWPIRETAQIGSSLVSYAPGLVEAISGLQELPQVNCYWISNMLEDAPFRYAPRIGLQYGVVWQLVEPIDRWDLGEADPWWKIPALLRHMERTQPDLAVWVDDDISQSVEAQRIIREYEYLHGIAPDANFGMTAEQFRFVAEVARNR